MREIIVRVLLLGIAVTGAFTFFNALHAQGENSFLKEALPLALTSQRETGVPASVTLAQAMWETGRGASPIGEANNYFGIKAGALADGTVHVGPIADGWVWAWTKEWNGTRYVNTRERFRKYRSMQDSFRDHSVLLATAPRYQQAMRAVDDPREFARRIAAAGYATSPTYAADLIRLMDAENLYQYDLPRNNAELIAQSETLTVNPGEIFQIYFDVRNTGFGTWSPQADYMLANLDEHSFGAAKTQMLDQLVAPERVKRWAMTMFAPRAPGTYQTIWQMQHGARGFGPRLEFQVRVRENESTNAAGIFLGVGGILFVSGSSYVLWKKRRGKTKDTR